jgi:Family of unknown function (DUF5901)
MIEDVEYLKDHCDNDATIIYVDSADRNRKYNPFPEEYTISFDQPFKLVTGFDVLDASIPTTMWNVDKYNGTLALTTCTVPTAIINKELAKTYFDEFKATDNFSVLFERSHVTGAITENFIVVITEDYYITYNVVESETLTPYFAFVRTVIQNTSIKETPKNLDTSSYYVFTSRGTSFYIDYSETDTINILEEKNFDVQLNADNLYDIVYFRKLNIREVDYNSIKNTNNFVYNIKNLYKQISLGNYDLTSLRTELNNVWGEYDDIAFDATSLPDRKQGIFIIRSSGFLIINASIGKLIKQIGFDTLPRIEDSTLYTPDFIGSNLQVFTGVYDTLARNYKIQAPGIVNLLGYRYLILRCKEMEDHLLGSYAYINYTPGIGLFKLASSYNDVTHLRFDFVNLVRKPFHPIGKLSKLTFRFETQDGNLYDFKGVNHQMLFVIKFLTPTQKVRFDKGILNPNYNPNFMNYISGHRTIEYKEDSDAEDDFTNHKYENKYKQEIQEYDYSSSNSDSSDDDDDNDSDSEVEFDFSQGLNPKK